jgi:predicted ester cyclase
VPNANALVVRRFVDEYQSGGDVAVAEELLAHDFVNHSPVDPLPPDRDGVLALFGMLRGAFPDLHAVIHDQLTDGDKVVTRKTFHGTHHGPRMDIKPTGREVAWDVIDIVRVRDGKMVEHWNVVDTMALMQQLGAVPGAD